MDVLEDQKIEWRPEGLWILWQSQKEDLEFLPALAQKGKLKQGRSSHQELRELRLRLPELREKLKAGEALHSQQLALGDWVIARDIQKDFAPDPPKIPCLLNPEIVLGLFGEDANHSSNCEQVIQGHWKRHGLLGIPIAAGGHWTLLVARRSGGDHFKFHDEKFVQIRYYESLQAWSSSCWEVAEKIILFLVPNVDPQKIKENRCQTFQQDPTSCGHYVLHYWEGEVRQYLGQGWVVGRPFQKIIKQREARLIAITKDIEEFAKDDAAKIAAAELAAAKKGMKVTEKGDLAFVEGPCIPTAAEFFDFLTKEAKRSMDLALVPFYGCSRCRFSRGGCIDWKCNPMKFQAHIEKFPEKYEGRMIRSSSWKSVSINELSGDP